MAVFASTNTTDEKQENKNNINIKELQKLFERAMGNRNTSQFINDCGILYDTQAIIDILNGKFNPAIRLNHLRRIAQVSEGRVKLEDMADILGYNVSDSIQSLINIQPKRGDIYMINLGDALDQEQGGVRPALVVQNNKGNSVSSCIQIIPLSKALDKGYYIPTHVIIGRESGLYYESVALVEQTRCISKSRLKINGEIIRVGSVNECTMRQIESALKKEYGLIELQFNFNTIRKMIAAYISVNTCAKKISNNGLTIAKELLLSDIIDYCTDYGKDYVQMIKEYNNELILSRTNKEFKLQYAL